MRTVANLSVFIGLFVGLSSFLFGSISATHIVLIGVLFILFGIGIHLDLRH